VTIPAGAWTARNLAAGLTAFPRPGAFTQSGAGAPEGVEAWVKSWTIYQYDLPVGLCPILTENYPEIRPPDRAFISESNRLTTSEALSELAALEPGQRVPRELDDRFATIAADRRKERWVEQLLYFPLIRGAAVWANPFASMGWPAEIDAVPVQKWWSAFRWSR
jgi:hypothetical protein